ncbi:CesT family type III secretion system chaperone [Pokkaliibacter plantistimulans]|uniref:CesT family type III secretion system chaperone n=1 Tax=Pokkaliibacter plantistimulans TaxID=1635171 RepID=UPI001402CC9D|nr:CesT family type III secretion system chaperone [Pokkaliibacter plantistimulans]
MSGQNATIIRERLAAWLASKGMGQLRFGEDDRCVVSDDHGQECLLWQPQGSTVLHVFLHLQSLDGQHDMDVLVFAMALNLDPGRVGELVLGYNPESQQLLASIRLDLAVLSFDQLDERIESILLQASRLRDELDAFRLHRQTGQGRKPNTAAPLSLSQRSSLGL